MQFNMNEFLISVSFALDFVEMDVLGRTTNHSKRVAYLSLKIAEELGMSFEELHDVVALAIMHDNGVSEKSLHDKFTEHSSSNIGSLERIKEHCTIGEENVRHYPFLTDIRDVIKYHHERYDGTGFYGLKGSEIPLMSQIINFADTIEINFDIQSSNPDTRNGIFKFVKDYNGKLFSPEVVNSYSKIVTPQYWLDMKDDSISNILKQSLPRYSVDLSFNEVHKMTHVMSGIIDSKSKYTQTHSMGLEEKTALMTDFYGIKNDEKMKLIIAADLHDIGKLAVPNRILDSPNKLTDKEFEIVKDHPYYTRLALREISGFEEITEWAANHHEKLNGKGYPLGITGKDLDFNSRLIACLDIYEALTEERPYRKPLNHNEAMEILNMMSYDGLIDSKITGDIGYAFNI